MFVIRNVFIKNAYKNLKIGDLGLARIIDSETNNLNMNSFAGTLRYSSIEILDRVLYGESIVYTKESDIW